MKYDEKSFKYALDEKLEKLRTTREQFLRDVIYEQVIAAVHEDFAVVQGGGAVRGLLGSTAPTKDIDLLILNKPANQMKLYSLDLEDRNRVLLGTTRSMIDSRPTDFCQIRLHKVVNFFDMPRNQLAGRIEGSGSVGPYRLEHPIDIDLGLQHHPIRVEQVQDFHLLRFADVHNKPVTTLSPEDLAAAKISILLEHHNDADRFRAQDIVHTAALMQNFELDKEYFARALAFNSFQRNVTHELSNPLPVPDAWAKGHMQFDDLARRYHINLNVARTMQVIRQGYEPVQARASEIANDLVRGDYSIMQLYNLDAARVMETHGPLQIDRGDFTMGTER